MPLSDLQWQRARCASSPDLVPRLCWQQHSGLARVIARRGRFCRIRGLEALRTRSPPTPPRCLAAVRPPVDETRSWETVGRTDVQEWLDHFGTRGQDRPSPRASAAMNFAKLNASASQAGGRGRRIGLVAMEVVSRIFASWNDALSSRSSGSVHRAGRSRARHALWWHSDADTHVSRLRGARPLDCPRRLTLSSRGEVWTRC